MTETTEALDEETMAEIAQTTMAIHQVTAGRSFPVVATALGNCLLGGAVAMPHLRGVIADHLELTAAEIRRLGDVSPEEADRLLRAVFIGPDGKPLEASNENLPAGATLQ